MKIAKKTQNNCLLMAVPYTGRKYKNVRHVCISSPLSAELFSRGSHFNGFEFELGAPENYVKRGRVSNLDGLPQVFSKGSHFGSSCAQATHAVMGAMLTYSLCTSKIFISRTCVRLVTGDIRT